MFYLCIGLLTSLAGSTEINIVKAGKYTILDLGCYRIVLLYYCIMYVSIYILYIRHSTILCYSTAILLASLYRKIQCYLYFRFEYTLSRTDFSFT